MKKNKEINQMMAEFIGAERAMGNYVDDWKAKVEEHLRLISLAPDTEQEFDKAAEARLVETANEIASFIKEIHPRSTYAYRLSHGGASLTLGINNVVMELTIGGLATRVSTPLNEEVTMYDYEGVDTAPVNIRVTNSDRFDRYEYYDLEVFADVAEDLVEWILLNGVNLGIDKELYNNIES